MSIATRGNGRELAMRPEQVDYGDAAQPVVRYTIHDMEVMAKRAADSRLFGMDANQVFTLMMICEAEGRHPMEAVRRYHVIQNRPALKADAALADMMRAGWLVEWTTDPRDREEQAATFRHERKCPEGKAVSFTMEDARLAGITAKDNWKHWAPAMLRARVSTIACRMLEPGIITGLYTVEEVQDMDDRPAPAAQAIARSPLRRALDDASRGPVSTTGSEPARPSTDFGAWVELKATEAWGLWRDAARSAGVEPGKAITRYQVGNGLINAWIAEGLLDESAIQTEGKRDRNKVALELSAAWEYEPDDVKAQVEEYLREKILGLAAEAKVAVPGITPETEDAAESEPAGDLWPEGRE